MALPVDGSGVTSCGGLHFVLELAAGFLHQGNHLRPPFVFSRFDTLGAMANTLAAGYFLYQLGKFGRHANHRAEQPIRCQELLSRGEA